MAEHRARLHPAVEIVGAEFAQLERRLAQPQPLGMRVLGLSCLSNKNLPDCMTPAPLEEIILVAAQAGKNLGRLIRAMVTKL